MSTSRLRRRRATDLEPPLNAHVASKTKKYPLADLRLRREEPSRRGCSRRPAVIP